jgi:hypothetical protein
MELNSKSDIISLSLRLIASSKDKIAPLLSSDLLFERPKQKFQRRYYPSFLVELISSRIQKAAYISIFWIFVSVIKS